MKLKFKGVRLNKYMGADGFGGVIELKRGDECDVSESVADAIMRHYYIDFEKVEEKGAEFTPQKNKQLSKGAKFKSK